MKPLILVMILVQHAYYVVKKKIKKIFGRI